MRLHIACIGRLKSGPERQLFDRYADRIEKAGRGVALGPLSVIERPESRAVRADDRKAEESQALLSALPSGALIVALDETGKQRSSESFAQDLRQWRDASVSDLAFAIGGADGHDPRLLRTARATLALGPMTWPHQIVRGLVAEQLYRAITIISGHPYHRS